MRGGPVGESDSRENEDQQENLRQRDAPIQRFRCHVTATPESVAVSEIGGPGDARELAERIYAGVGGSSWDDVRTFVYGSDRGRIGQLAQAVAAAAGAGDKMAIDILHGAVVELARLANALIARTTNLPVAFVGGVMDIHPGIRSGLERELQQVEVRFPRIDASLRAAKLALASAMGAKP